MQPARSIRLSSGPGKIGHHAADMLGLDGDPLVLVGPEDRFDEPSWSEVPGVDQGAQVRGLQAEVQPDEVASEGAEIGERLGRRNKAAASLLVEEHRSEQAGERGVQRRDDHGPAR
ncbi:hypothetical protein [Methylorubrum extorquens]